MVRLKSVEGVKYLYHEPCHTPMKTYNSITVASALMGQEVHLSDRCCGEAGTFAVSRPDIAVQVKSRKEEELYQEIRTLAGSDRARSGNVKMLTSCPACQQGLERYSESTGLDIDYNVVELLRQRHGENWAQEFIERVQRGGIERILL